MSDRPAVLWLRRDLRRHDHPALSEAAAAAQRPLYPLFVIDPVPWHSAGTTRRAWLAASVRAAEESYDGRLTILYGEPAEVVARFARSVGAGSVHVSAETTPYGRRRDRRVQQELRDCELLATGSPYAVGPGLVLNKSGDPYKVFTAFARGWREHGWPDPAPAPPRLELAEPRSTAAARELLDDAIDAVDIELPEAGEQAALRRWQEFLGSGLEDYAHERDRPDHTGTSAMSPYLKVGAIHPRTLLADLTGRDAATFVNEIAWREFYADVVHHHPDSVWHDLRPELSGLRYDDRGDAFDAWCAGRTGYPMVDAGMRQLLATGWMHNRARMIVASFLTKDLHTWWPAGARHFLDHLIDGDIASNNHGWQWVAGTGTDAAPYFRVFNPVTQGRRFDPQGDYVRRWVPELRHLQGADVHEPWRRADGYDHDYPRSLVDHSHERREALDRYRLARGQ